MIYCRQKNQSKLRDSQTRNTRPARQSASWLRAHTISIFASSRPLHFPEIRSHVQIYFQRTGQILSLKALSLHLQGIHDVDILGALQGVKEADNPCVVAGDGGF